MGDIEAVPQVIIGLLKPQTPFQFSGPDGIGLMNGAHDFKFSVPGRDGRSNIQDLSPE